MLGEMSKKHANLFIPHIGKISERLTQKGKKYMPALQVIVNIVIKILPALISGKKQCKCAAYRIFALEVRMGWVH